MKKKLFTRIRIHAKMVIALMLLLLGSCNRIYDEASPAPPPVGDPIVGGTSSGQGKAMFCYNKSDEHQPFCIRQLSTELGSSIECSQFEDYLNGWDYLAGVEAGVKQFVFYHNKGVDAKNWMITEMLPTGQMGAVTDGNMDRGAWQHNYETLVGFHVGSRGFIFGQDSYGDNRWFVQEITSEGKLAPNESDAGSWRYYYKAATPLYVGPETYLYFQTEFGDKRWFIAWVSPDGKLSPMYEGTWDDFWDPVTSVTVDNKTYLVGIRKVSMNLKLSEWFIRRIWASGNMGEETGRGLWNNYYHILTSFTFGGKSCIFGHNDGYGYTDGNWFIQEITADGKMGAELSHGGIDKNDTFFYPFSLSEPSNFRFVVGWEEGTTGKPYTWSSMYSQPWTASANFGGGAALADINRDPRASLDAVLMGIQDRKGDDRFYYQVAWDMNYQGKPASWSKTFFGPYCGQKQVGGGAEIADIDRNGIPDLVLMSVDDPGSSNYFWYYIGWNLSVSGEPASWSGKFMVNTDGMDLTGGGLAIGDLDGNGLPEMVLMVIYNPAGANTAWYKVGRNLDKNGNAASWTKMRAAPFYLGDLSAGGGAALGDLNGNGKPDLVLMDIDSPQGPNPFWYYIGWDIDINGNAVSWSNYMRPAVGNITSGGGLAIGDIDKNGLPDPDLLLMTVDNPYGKD